MRNRLVLTITTVSGSRQYSLHKLAKYLLPFIGLMFVLGLVVSNLLLKKTFDELSVLEIDHQQLADQYVQVLGKEEYYRTELDTLVEDLHLIEGERDHLRQVSSEAAAERERYKQRLFNLETSLGLARSAEMTEARARELSQIASERLFMLHGIPNGKPIEGAIITDRFGMRNHPVSGKRKLHEGIDFRAEIGTPVYATADGAVEYAGYHKASGYGNLLVISHNFGFKSYYGHLSKVAVKSRAMVRKGQLIGYSGNTGVSTGPHLHYEIRYLYSAVDPRPFLEWGMDNYEPIFTKVKGIAWASLREMNPATPFDQPLL